MTSDKQADALVDAIIQTNRSNSYGDGKIFVTPAKTAYTIRTGQPEL